jgi:hypothetical protein
VSSTTYTTRLPPGSGVWQANESLLLEEGVGETQEGDEAREDLLESTPVSGMDVMDMGRT